MDRLGDFLLEARLPLAQLPLVQEQLLRLHAPQRRLRRFGRLYHKVNSPSQDESMQCHNSYVTCDRQP